TSQEIAQGQVLDRLESIAGQYRISINGTAVPNSTQVLQALKSLKWMPAHHSSPTKRLTVEISDHSQRVIFSLARDSGNPREYWVFYPTYYITKYNEIGRIVTPLFDSY